MVAVGPSWSGQESTGERSGLKNDVLGPSFLDFGTQPIIFLATVLSHGVNSVCGKDPSPTQSAP